MKEYNLKDNTVGENLPKQNKSFFTLELTPTEAKVLG